MKAVILCGGKGTRLMPLTTSFPKPLMPIGDMPILEIILKQLKSHGFKEVILTVGHLSGLLQAFFQDGSQLGLKVTYSFEDEALGTAGPLSLVLDQLDEDFMMMNGDLLTTLSYENMYAFHKKTDAAITVGAHRRDINIDFGVLQLSDEGLLLDYIEKPTETFHVSMGVYVINPEVLRKYLKVNEPRTMPDLILQMRDAGEKIMTYTEPCYWLDIGRLEDYSVAVDEFEQRRHEFLP